VRGRSRRNRRSIRIDRLTPCVKSGHAASFRRPLCHCCCRLQDPLNYESRAHHSSLDVYEEAPPDDLKRASVILASFVYHAAMRDEMLPRPKVADPPK
jgi:hypothetical protein